MKFEFNMNRFFKIIFIFILLTLSSLPDAILPENEVSIFSLIEKKGTTYQISSKIPFTGIAVHYRSNGQLDYKKRFINGKLNGDTEYFHFNGELGLKEKYQDGEKEGIQERYFYNGQLVLKEN